MESGFGMAGAEGRTKNRQVRCPQEVVQVSTKERKAGTNLLRGLEMLRWKAFDVRDKGRCGKEMGIFKLQIPRWTRSIPEHTQPQTYISSSTLHLGCLSISHSCPTSVWDRRVPCRLRCFRCGL